MLHLAIAARSRLLATQICRTGQQQDQPSGTLPLYCGLETIWHISRPWRLTDTDGVTDRVIVTQHSGISVHICLCERLHGPGDCFVECCDKPIVMMITVAGSAMTQRST